MTKRPQGGGRSAAHASSISASRLSSGGRRGRLCCGGEAAVVSTILVFLLLSWQRGDGDRRYLPEPTSGTPDRINLQQPASGGEAADKRTADIADGLVRRADALISNGEIEAARVLLQRRS